MASNFISITESLHFIRNFSLLRFTSVAGNPWFGNKSCIFNWFFPLDNINIWIQINNFCSFWVFDSSRIIFSVAYKKFAMSSWPKKSKIMSKLKKNKLDIILYLFGFLFSWILFCIYCCLYSLLKDMKYISFSKN